jgi:hypothetical protein
MIVDEIQWKKQLAEVNLIDLVVGIEKKWNM